MKNFLILILVLAVAMGALGYWRGWFSVNKEEDGKIRVQVNTEKFQKDKAAFSKTAGEKAKALKDQVAGLWKKSETLTGDEKAHAQKELGELKEKHERIEHQLKELDEAGQGKFEDIRRDLSKNLEEVEAKIEVWTKKLEKGKEK